MKVAKSINHEENSLLPFICNVDKFQFNVLNLMRCDFLEKCNFHCIRGKTALLSALFLLSLDAADATLSATTVQTIQGTKPYFTLGGVPLTNTAELLGFTYINSNGTSGTKATADDAVDGTTIIVDPNMEMSELIAIVPINNTSTQLSAILGTDLNVEDDDGDTLGGISAIGAMKAYWTKDGVTGYTPISGEKFSACSTYQLTIAFTDPDTGAVASVAGNIEALTIYGDPNSQSYAYPATAGTTPTPIYSATYTIEPKPGIPYACYAQPNLTHGTGQYAGPTRQWNPTKGFLPQIAPAKNFPTTGFYGAWFNLTVKGTTASDIVRTMTTSPTTVGGKLTGYTPFKNGVKLKLVANAPDIVTVTLYGPRDGTVTSQSEASVPTAKFTPTTFTITDSSSMDIYRFTIEKWFITKDVSLPYSSNSSEVWSASNPYGFDGNLETPKYCENLGGTAGNYYYHIPTRLDYTNSIEASQIAWNGTAGTGFSNATINYYRRTIGGGVFTEWGNIDKQAGNYTESEWTGLIYWTSEPAGEKSEYISFGYNGLVADYYTKTIGRPACVSD